MKESDLPTTEPWLAHKQTWKPYERENTDNICSGRYTGSAPCFSSHLEHDIFPVFSLCPAVPECSERDIQTKATLQLSNTNPRLFGLSPLCLASMRACEREREREIASPAHARAPFARKRFRVSVQAGPSRRRGMLGSRAERILKGSYAVVQIRVLWVIDLGLQSSWCFFSSFLNTEGSRSKTPGGDSWIPRVFLGKPSWASKLETPGGDSNPIQLGHRR